MGIAHPVAGAERGTLSRWERLLLALAVIEIPLQIDKYLWFRADVAEVGSIGGVNVSITTFCLIALYGLWFLRSACDSGFSGLRWQVGWPQATFVAVSAVSFLGAGDGQLAFFELTLVVQAFLLYVYFANRLGDVKDLRWVLGALVVCGLVQSIFVCASLVLHRWWGLDAWSLGPLELEVTPEGRPGGTLRSPTGAGSMLTLLTLIAAPLAVIPGRQWTWIRRGALSLVVGGTLAVLLTKSRGAIGTLVLGMTVIGWILWWRGWMPKHAIRVAFLVAALSAVPFAAVIRERIMADDRGSAASRIHLTHIALELIEDHGWLGVGAGNAPVVLREYANQSPYRSEWFYLTHCRYLVIWSELGFAGLIAFVAMLGTGIFRGLRTASLHMPWPSHVGLGMSIALICQSSHMLVDVFNGRPHVEMLWLVLGMVDAAHRMSIRSRAQPAISARRQR